MLNAIGDHRSRLTLDDSTQATNDTGSGDPKHSTAEKGERYLRHVCHKFASYLIELAAADTEALYERP
jgi:creatinine amidohydrolase